MERSTWASAEGASGSGSGGPLTYPGEPDPSAAIAPHLDLALAARLARAGQMGAAEQLLAPSLEGGRSDPQALDLQARICCQQGRLGEAAALWQRALTLAPGTASFAAALHRVCLLQRRHPAVDRGVTILAAMAIGLTVLSTGAGLSRRLAMLEARVRQGPAPESQRSQRGPDRLHEGAEPASQPGAGLVSLASQLNLPGLTWQREGQDLVGLYTDGLFDRGTHYRRGARKALTTFGRRLAAVAPGLQLEVTGTTDEVALSARSRFADRLGLSLARAESVVRHLRNTAGLDASIVWVPGRDATACLQPGGPQRSPSCRRSAVMRLRHVPGS